MAQGKAALRSKLLPAGSVADQGLNSIGPALQMLVLCLKLSLYYSATTGEGLERNASTIQSAAVSKADADDSPDVIGNLLKRSSTKRKALKHARRRGGRPIWELLTEIALPQARPLHTDMVGLQKLVESAMLVQ